MKVKYLVLDFGKVLAYPVSGNWFITPNFYKYVDKNKIKIEDLKIAFNQNAGKEIGDILENEKEEIEMFKNFYKKAFKQIKYENKNIDDISLNCAIDFVKNNDKYKLYDDTYLSLEKLSKKYKLICLSDNWPSGRRYMKDLKIYDLFEKVYISSDYGYTKKELLLFDHPIKDFDIKENEAIFVDDDILNLDAANKKGFIPILMDRDKKVDEKSIIYKKIDMLSDLNSLL